jgi:hypothetical protein
MRENRPYGSMRGGGAKPELTITVSLIRRYHPAYSTGLGCQAGWEFGGVYVLGLVRSFGAGPKIPRDAVGKLTLRAAGLLAVGGVGSGFTARCGDAQPTAEIPRRSIPRNFRTGSQSFGFYG